MNVQYPKYPKYNKSVQTMYPVHSSKSSQQHKLYYIPKHNSSPYSQLIPSFFVVRCTFLIYTYRILWKCTEPTQNKLKQTRFNEEVLKTTGNWVSPNLT